MVVWFMVAALGWKEFHQFEMCLHYTAFILKNHFYKICYFLGEVLYAGNTYWVGCTLMMF